MKASAIGEAQEAVDRYIGQFADGYWRLPRTGRYVAVFTIGFKETRGRAVPNDFLDLALGEVELDIVAEAARLLHAAARTDGAFEADVMNQTLSLTTIGKLEPRRRVNLETDILAELLA